MATKPTRDARLDADEVQSVRDMTRLGYSPRVIADQCGVEYDAVRALVRREKLRRPRTVAAHARNRKLRRLLAEAAKAWT